MKLRAITPPEIADPGFAGRVVGTSRFELPTCRLGGDRSIHLSYVPEPPYIPILPALQPFLSDVPAIVHSVEVDFSDLAVRVPDRLREIRATRGHTQHTPAGSL
jgi:hypothetical protein